MKKKIENKKVYPTGINEIKDDKPIYLLRI